MKLLLRWTRRLLFAGGASLLAYCGYVLIDSWNFQRMEIQRFQQSLTARVRHNRTCEGRWSNRPH